MNIMLCRLSTATCLLWAGTWPGRTVTWTLSCAGWVQRHVCYKLEPDRALLLHEHYVVQVEYSDMSVMSWNLTGLYCHMNPVFCRLSTAMSVMRWNLTGLYCHMNPVLLRLSTATCLLWVETWLVWTCYITLCCEGRVQRHDCYELEPDGAVLSHELCLV